MDPESETADFYEVEIGGVLYRMSRKDTAEIASAILRGREDAAEAVAEAFARHPNMEKDVPTEIDPDKLV
jgi:hypothetical protein